MSSEENRHTEEVNPAAQRLVEHGLNTVTGGNWSRVKHAPIVGKRLQGVENGLAKRIKPKHVDPASRKRPDGLGVAPSDKKPDEAGIPENNSGKANPEQRIQDVNNNRTGWLHRKGRKKAKPGLGNNEGENQNPNDNPTSEEKDKESIDIFSSKAIKNLVKGIATAVVAIALPLFLIIAAICGIFGINIAQAVPLVGPNTYGTDNYQSVYEEGTQERKNEIAYQEKLLDASKKYAETHGEELKINYIHQILIGIYFEGVQEISTDNNNGVFIDYSKMSSMIDSIVELMTPSEDGKYINYEKNGEFYNNLKNSDTFKNYYKKAIDKRLEEANIGTTYDNVVNELLNKLFDQAKQLDEMPINIDDTVMTGEVSVTVTEKVDNKQDSKKTLTINEYLADSIYANSNSVSNSEIVKAYTVVYSTNIVAQNKTLSITNNNVSMTNKTCSVKDGCSYNKDGNLVSGSGDRNNNNTLYYNGSYYYKPPLSSTETDNLNKNINSVFGNVLVNKDGTYPNLDVKLIGGLGDGNNDYKSILNTGYGKDLNYKNVGENNYILDANYGYKKVLTEVKFYDQNDYSSTRFCGLSGYSVAKSGCGVTSMAIVASTYEKDKKYDPVYMNNEATKRKMCGGGNTGTKQAFFGQMAKALKYKYIGGSKYDKSLLNQVLKHLSEGHLVVVRMGPGHFTSGGHYMVLGGVDPATKKVYVYDPFNKVNKGYRRTGNGWYSFNDIIVKEAFNFYIIWKG